MKRVLFPILILLFCLFGCARAPQTRPSGFGTELVRAERNGITVEVFFKNKEAATPQPIYRFTQKAGMLGLIGEPNLHISVVASDAATSASTTVYKTKQAFTAMTGMIVGAVGGGSVAGVPGAAVGAGAGGVAGKVVDKALPVKD